MSTSQRQKIILITGASSGMGKATAKQLINEGHIVYGAARRLKKMDDLLDMGGHAIEMDVANDQHTTEAVQRIIAEQGRIDVLINNAGFSVYGAVEDVSQEDARKQFEVNLFGLAFLTQKVLPHMRQQQHGHIINVTSVGGKIYAPLGAWYHASKHAVEGWSDCLRVETKSFGIKVSIIEPGAIASEFNDVMDEPMLERSRDGDYEDMAKANVKATKKIHNGSKDTKPEVIANTIVNAVNAKNPKTRYSAGKFAKPILFLRKWLSDKMFDKIVLSMLD